MFICGASGSAAAATFFAFFALFTISFKTFAPQSAKDKITGLLADVLRGGDSPTLAKLKAKAAAAKAKSKAPEGESAHSGVLA